MGNLKKSDKRLPVESENKGAQSKNKWRVSFFLHLFIDIVLLTAAYFSVYGISLNMGMEWIEGVREPFTDLQSILMPCLFVVITLACVYAFGAYKVRWRYTSTNDIIRIIIGSLAAFLVLSILTQTAFENVKIGFVIVYWVFSLVFLMMVRFFNRFVNTMKHIMVSRNFIRGTGKATLVYGGGFVGCMLINQLINGTNDVSTQYVPVGVIDDDPRKKGYIVGGLKVHGGRDSLQNTIDKTKAQAIIIAMYNISKKALKEIYLLCKETGLEVKIVPQITDNLRDVVGTTLTVREVRMEELLGRDEFEVNVDLINHFIRGRVVLVTGGAGSIGSELCRQALAYQCKHLIVFDVTENSVFELNQEFSQKYDKSRYTLVIGSIRDKAKLKATFDLYKPEVVFHAAAYKHVPMMEFSPVESIKNNVFGTRNVIDQCNASGVNKLVCISTDKAVNPANVMGASKRISEMLIQSKAATSKTQLSAVRFGNVLGSAGSVVGIFLDQIRKGGPVTLTHREIKRYFMTIPEACRLVMQAGAFAGNGEVFVLDMGEPVLIYDLAEDLIKMNGLIPGKDIEIVETGLRDGEKLFEELRYDGESVDMTMHKGIFICRLEEIDPIRFDEKLEGLVEAVKAEDQDAATEKIFEIVPCEARKRAKEEHDAQLSELHQHESEERSTDEIVS